MIDANGLKAHVRRRVAGFRCEDEGAYAYRGWADGESSLAASCDAALCLYAIDGFGGEGVSGWADYINSFQEWGSGWFVDERSVWVKPYRIEPWLFGLGLRGLNAVGGEPVERLGFLRAWESREAMREWIFAGKGVMHLAILWFGYGREYYPFDDFEETFFELLEEYGELYGPDRKGFREALAGYDADMAGVVLKDAFHNLYAWYASGRAIPAAELYVDWFLNEQDAEGLFFQEGSGAKIYSHMDGLQLVVEAMGRSDYRRDECAAAVAKGLDAIVSEKYFDVFWNDGWLHNLLASCEVVSQAVRVLRGHRLAESRWHCVWTLDMWRLAGRYFAIDR